MTSNPFSSDCFLGYVNEVAPQSVTIHFPAANLLSRFCCNGVSFSGGNVGEFVIIEGSRYGFLAKIFNLKLPDSERKELSAKSVEEDDSIFHPIAEAELLLSFPIADPTKAEKTISRYPEIGSRVYASSTEFVSRFVERFGDDADSKAVFSKLGRLASNDAECSVSLNALLGRHCAIVGTTGSGKSWTTSKVIEAILSNTENKVILIDPTGEYASLDGMRNRVCHVAIGEDCYFPYEQLSISDLICLLRPTGQAQRPILIEAVKSLKTVRLLGTYSDANVLSRVKRGCLDKTNCEKKHILNFQFKHQVEIEDGGCAFDITCLVRQIKYECVRPSNAQGNFDYWGVEDARTYDFQSSLLFRIQELTQSPAFKRLFNFAHDMTDALPITEVLEKFFKSRKKNRILRLDFSKTSSAFNAREIVANALSRYLYGKAKDRAFTKKPIVLMIDEAHLFLNKNLIDVDQSLTPLNAVDLIAKECRKFGLFLTLSTQMPRDIPVGTLSQMGAFIIHRLINEQDRRTVEMACSSATRTSMTYLPALGSGEAIMMGVAFPMPIPLRISPPSVPPNSGTPLLTPSKS